MSRIDLIRRGRTGLSAASLSVLVWAAFSWAQAHAVAGIPSCAGEKHCTDGGFNLHNGGLPTLDAPEWSGPNVVKSFFPRVADGSGGAFLYVEQGGGAVADNQLYLMYDYVNPAPGLGVVSRFQVFFQVKDEDYLVEINGSSLSVFVKPADQPSAVNPDGTLNNGPPWTPADASDLASGRFHGVVGFGASPNNSTPHPMAEFEVSIDETAFGRPEQGLYSPEPAFWSAGAIGSNGIDPPISSAIFQLNPNGTTTVIPVLGPNGGPVAQGNVTPAPEPGSLALLTAGILGALGAARRNGRQRS